MGFATRLKSGMNFFRKISIGQRLGFGLGLLVLMSASAGLLGWRMNDSLNVEHKSLYQQTSASNIIVREIESHMLRMHRNMKDVAMVHSANEMATALLKVNTAEGLILTELDTLAQVFPADQTELKCFRADFIAWKAIRDRVVDLKINGRAEEAAVITRGEGADHVAMLEQHIQGLISAVGSFHEQAAAEIMASQQRTTRNMTILMGLTVVLTLVVWLLFMRDITGPINSLARFADSIRHGDLSQRLAMKRHDELGVVGSALDDMAESIEQTREELVAHQKHLEERVEQRTADLVTANNSLNVEFDMREKIATQLMESEERLDMMITGSNDGFWDWPNMEYPDVWWSPKLYTLLDQDPDSFWPDFPAFLNLTHAEDRVIVTEIVADAVAGNDEPEMEVRIQAAGGQYRWFRLRARVFRDTDGKAYRMAGSLQDIHERKWAESQLRQNNVELETLNTQLKSNQNQLIQAEKMSSLGQLAAGVAHEINNPVGFISSNLGTMLEYIEAVSKLIDPLLDGAATDTDALACAKVRSQVQALLADEDYKFLLEDTQQLLTESIEGTERIAEIVKNLKTFARPDEDSFRSAHINQGLETSLKMVWNRLKYTCEVKKELNDIPLICCNIGRLNQVFMNLLVNASHAIEKDGEINISTEHRDAHVIIEISDNGQGISVENQRRIFDPFFTTKAVGEGTGLGLSISHGIIQDHRGTITVSSTVGQGTTFTIRIPDNLKPDDSAIEDSETALV